MQFGGFVPALLKIGEHIICCMPFYFAVPVVPWLPWTATICCILFHPKKEKRKKKLKSKTTLKKNKLKLYSKSIIELPIVEKCGIFTSIFTKNVSFH